MNTHELDDVMLVIEHLWPASTFRDLDEVETWRHHLEPLDADAVAAVLGVLASTGEYKRFRPDLPPILTAVAVHMRALEPVYEPHTAGAEPADVGWRVDEPTPEEKARGLEAIGQIRERLRHPA